MRILSSSVWLFRYIGLFSLEKRLTDVCSLTVLDRTSEQQPWNMKILWGNKIKFS